MKASMTILFEENADAASMAATLRMQAALLEGKTAKEAASRSNTDGDDDEAEEAAPAKKSSKKKAAPAKAASFDDEDGGDDSDEETEAVDTEDDDDDFKAPAPKAAAKKAKAPKISVDDVNDACKARASATGGKEGRAEVLGILKKKFKVASVTELTPDQYPAVIAAMEA